MKKNIFKAISALALMGVISTPVFAGEIEAQVTDNFSTVVEDTNFNARNDDRFRFQDVPVNNQPITTAGVSWDQLPNTPYARFYVSNTTNQQMTVFFTSPAGSFIPAWQIPAGQSRTSSMFAAATGNWRMSFTTPVGAVSGRVSVRIADFPLPSMSAIENMEALLFNNGDIDILTFNDFHDFQ